MPKICSNSKSQRRNNNDDMLYRISVIYMKKSALRINQLYQDSDALKNDQCDSGNKRRILQCCLIHFLILHGCP